MESNSNASKRSFEVAVLEAQVAQICNYVGYNAITQESANILTDLYRRTIHHLARHCKEAANNNRRVEPTLADVIQAYDFVGIPISELGEHIETVKLPSPINTDYSKEKLPSNRIQRNLLVDDLLEAEKSTQLEDQDDNGESRATDESGIEEDERPSVPLFRDTFSELASKFPESGPVKADKKIRLGGRILLRTNQTQLKISAPIGDIPEPLPSTSKLDNKSSKLKKKKEKVLKRRKKQDISPKKIEIKIANDEKIKEEVTDEIAQHAPVLAPEVVSPTKKGRTFNQGKGKKKRKNVSREFVAPSPKKDSTRSPLEKDKESRASKKAKIAITPLDPAVAEPPSFLPILESAIKEESIVEPEPPARHTPVITPISTPIPSLQPVKHSKGKKKRKEKSNQFAIVTETVSATDDAEWFCPACKGPDDGDLMVQCDTCEEWYHLKCTGLKKPPNDDENWDCQKCHTPTKSKSQKRPQPSPVIEPPPVKVIAKTPEPVITPTPTLTPTLKPTPKPVIATTSGTTQDDLCPECNLPDDGTMMIQCDDPFCAKWFHGKCVGLVNEPKEDESWFCKVCVDKQQSAFKRRRRAK